MAIIHVSIEIALGIWTFFVHGHHIDITYHLCGAFIDQEDVQVFLSAVFLGI